ncbi:hypothetical protein [Streptomyces sp. NPDC046821]|uniref:hypothetical protein n=1 Tax=Streptomyces sp. NPDC046821 TaxID=3154702 RepID=UPI0033E84C67
MTPRTHGRVGSPAHLRAGHDDRRVGPTLRRARTAVALTFRKPAHLVPPRRAA